MASTASVVIGHEAVPLHQITPIGGCVGAGNGKPTLVALFRPDDSDNVMAVTASRQTREVHAASRLTLSEPLAHKVPNATEASDALTVLRKWLQEQKEITRTGGRKARGCRIDPAVSPEPTVPTVPKADKTPANAPANAPAKARARSKPPYKTKDRASDKGKEMVDLAKTRRYSEITSTSRNGDGWLPGEQVDICLAYLGKPTTGGLPRSARSSPQRWGSSPNLCPSSSCPQMPWCMAMTASPASRNRGSAALWPHPRPHIHPPTRWRNTPTPLGAPTGTIRIPAPRATMRRWRVPPPRRRHSPLSRTPSLLQPALWPSRTLFLTLLHPVPGPHPPSKCTHFFGTPLRQPCPSCPPLPLSSSLRPGSAATNHFASGSLTVFGDLHVSLQLPSSFQAPAHPPRGGVVTPLHQESPAGAFLGGSLGSAVHQLLMAAQNQNH